MVGFEEHLPRAVWKSAIVIYGKTMEKKEFLAPFMNFFVQSKFDHGTVLWD